MKKRSYNFVVGGMQPLTMIDFPGRLATVLFAQGCNLRCRFCYNKTLLPDTAREVMPWDSIIEFLKDRQGFIEGVVFSGGEACRQKGFIQALEEVRDLGFDTALHTNGFYPEKIESALKLRLLDYIAVDLKGAFRNYESITGELMDEERFEKVVDLIVQSGIDHEFRTTVHPDLIKEDEILELSERLASLGVKKYVLQKFQHGEALDRKLASVSTICLKPATIIKLKSRFESFEIRGEDSYLDSVKSKIA